MTGTSDRPKRRARKNNGWAPPRYSIVVLVARPLWRELQAAQRIESRYIGRRLSMSRVVNTILLGYFGLGEGK